VTVLIGVLRYFFIFLAYLLSFWVRLEWIEFAQDHYLDEDGSVQYLRPDMVKNGIALPNTHDSFYFGSILQKAHLGMHQENDLIPGVFENGIITYLPYTLLKLFPSLEIETLLLWLPVCVAGLVCIPIVLIGRLYGSSLWGFFAACIAGITHSYYNRTLAGYYDTDMFSVTLPAFALFFLLAASRRESLRFLLAGALVLYISRFFYGSIQAISCSMALTFLSLRWGIVLLEHINSKKSSGFMDFRDIFKGKSFNFACKSTIFISWLLYTESWSHGRSVESSPSRFLIGLLVPIIIFIYFSLLDDRKKSAKTFDLKDRNTGKTELAAHSLTNGRKLVNIFSLCLLGLLFLGVAPFINIGPLSGTWSKITGKLESYSVISGSSAQSASKSFGYSLNFKNVKTTIREASEIPPEVVRNRILGDSPSCSCPRCLPENEKNEAFIIPTAFIGFIGIFLLILRYWEMCLTLPFAAIAYYCFSGSVGLRFTVHVGNAASLGLVFLILVVLWFIFRFVVRKYFLSQQMKVFDLAKYGTWCLSACLICFFAIPNIQHAKNYNSHVVYPIKTIEVLDKLNEASNPRDFVITWWDYGSGCWFYGQTRTFTSPAHQTFDNFLTSEILRSTSPSRAVNLSRLKTETYVDLHNERKDENKDYSTAVQAIFKDGSADLEFYEGLMADVANSDYSLPQKTRENFLFLPYEILRIFPTILSFSSRNLYLGENSTLNQSMLKEPPMVILKNGRREGSSVIFDENYRFDKRGNLLVSGNKSGVIPYGQILEVSVKGGSAYPVSSILFEELNIPVNPSPNAARRLLFIKEEKEFVILSPSTFRSTFAKRFLLDKFDSHSYNHPLFPKSIFPKKQPYMAQADWVTQSGQTLILNMRGGYRIEADISTNSAKIPGVEQAVSFNFHRLTNKPDGSLVKIPTKKLPNARFHLVQANLPVFLSDRSYEIPQGGKSLLDVAKLHGLAPSALASETGKDLDHKFKEFTELIIPAKGYELRPAFFFMDDEVFSSTLVQGFLMENLDPAFFEKIFTSPWGKVYKMLD
jgi:dolichyl-diphosphooligosaccharide--protein glycosyltransferase/undecaprenyl-diphosphooligosaccharide--protein glycosyltransferase